MIASRWRSGVEWEGGRCVWGGGEEDHRVRGKGEGREPLGGRLGKDIRKGTTEGMRGL